MAGMGNLRKVFSSVVNFTVTGTKAAALTFITLNYVGGFVVCKGPSMEPTLKTNDILLTEHISPRLKRIDVGDVIVARSPGDSRCICKRVVAGPGDIVLFKNRTLTVPEDYVWLEGDNKENSNDSRYYGPIPMSNVRRRCYCKIYPEFDLRLDIPSRFFLESNPSPPQKEYHRCRESQMKQMLIWERRRNDAETGSNSGEAAATIKIDNAYKDSWFPQMRPSDNQSRSNNDNGQSTTPTTQSDASSCIGNNHLNDKPTRCGGNEDGTRTTTQKHDNIEPKKSETKQDETGGDNGNVPPEQEKVEHEGSPELSQIFCEE